MDKPSRGGDALLFLDSRDGSDLLRDKLGQELEGIEAAQHIPLAIEDVDLGTAIADEARPLR